MEAAEAIEVMDILFPRGIPLGTCMMVNGDAGIGTSTLGYQLTLEGLKRGESVIYVCADLEPERIRQAMSYLNFKPDVYEKEGKLILIDACDPDSEENHRISDITNIQLLSSKILSTARGLDAPIRIIQDSATALVLRDTDDSVTRHVYNLNKNLRKMQLISLDIYTSGAHSDKLISSISNAYDGVIRMYGGTKAGGIPTRNIQVVKMRMTLNDPRPRTFVIRHGIGVIIDKSAYEV